MKYRIYISIHLFLCVTYIFLAMSDWDSPAWFVMNVSILVGIISPILFWTKTNFKIIGYAIAYLKLMLILFFTWGWWQLSYSEELTVKSTEFFWGMSPFLLVLGIFETQIIDNYLIKKT